MKLDAYFLLVLDWFAGAHIQDVAGRGYAALCIPGVAAGSEAGDSCHIVTGGGLAHGEAADACAICDTIENPTLPGIRGQI